MKKSFSDIEVKLSRQDFFYYNWVMAFERPTLPFLIYTLTALALLSILGVFPWARSYALAAFVPLVGYFLWLWLSTQLLWQKFAEEFRQTRQYSFYEEAYRTKIGAKNFDNPYAKLAKVIESRQAFYLFHENGQADILTKDALLRAKESLETMREFLGGRGLEPQKSTFL
ncbi:MAG: YcxB family protein [Deinococcales bacterium]